MKWSFKMELYVSVVHMLNEHMDNLAEGNVAQVFHGIQQLHNYLNYLWWWRGTEY